MRDAADTLTAEIPGVDPLPPPPPPRLTIARRRELSGYNAPKLAPGCRHCTHRLEGINSLGKATHACGLHDFPVELGAICGSWCAA